MMPDLQIDKRTYTSGQPFETDKPALFDLTYISLIHLSGEKSCEFLQGQLTADIRNVTNFRMQPSAQCNLKGRILALMDVICWKDEIYLILPNDLVDATVTSLNKTAPLSRVTLKTALNVVVFGFYLPDNRSVYHDLPLPDKTHAATSSSDYYIYSLGNNTYQAVMTKPFADQWRDSFIDAGSQAWHYLQLTHKKIEIYPTSRGLFLPHRLDLHKTDYLSFDKGCYKGQEIIARTHYRATLKHVLSIYKLNCNEPIYIGQRIMSTDNQQELGELVDFCPLSEHQFLVAVSIKSEHDNPVKLEGHQLPATFIYAE